MKTINKLMALLALVLMWIWSVSAANIEKLEALDNVTVQLTANSDITFPTTDIKGDVKLLKDIPVSFSVKDVENLKKVTVNLSWDLAINNSYSLISILGAEWNIDFNIWTALNGEKVNADLTTEEDWISKINIIDSRTIELYFTKDLSEETFEFKILSEVKTKWLRSEGNNKLILDVEKPLEKSTNYIIMVLSLEDASGNPVTFEEDLYDFVTSADLIEKVAPEVQPITNTELVATQSWEVVEWNVEEVAMNAVAFPKTGAGAWVIILIAFLANIAFFLRKKIVK